MAEVLAILTLDDVREMHRYSEKMPNRAQDEEFKPLSQLDYAVTFERGGERYQCRMCDCDSDEMQAFGVAWMRVVGEAQRKP